jgi:hypothetical protein
MAETCSLSSIDWLNAIKLYSVVFTTEYFFHLLYIVSSTQRGRHTSKLPKRVKCGEQLEGWTAKPLHGFQNLNTANLNWLIAEQPIYCLIFLMPCPRLQLQILCRLYCLNQLHQNTQLLQNGRSTVKTQLYFIICEWVDHIAKACSCLLLCDPPTHS